MLSEKKPDILDEDHAITYGSRSFSESVPKFFFPKETIPSSVAYQIVHDELNLYHSRYENSCMSPLS
jgi:glutamate decarboxylase